MKVLLINPHNVGKFGLQNVFQVEPLGLEILAAALAKDHDVVIQDLRFNPDLNAQLDDFRPDLVGISCLYTSHTGATWQIAQQVKSRLPTATVVVGGQPPTLAPHFFESPFIDYIVRGDGEVTLPNLCRHLEGSEELGSIPAIVANTPQGQQSTGPRPQPRPFEELPAPRRLGVGVSRENHFLSFARPVALVEVNRGCPFDCDFCSIWKMGQSTLRTKTIDQVLTELSSLDETDVFFADDHFFANPKFMTELGRAVADAELGKVYKVQSRADAIARNPDMLEAWVQAGLRQVFLGLEGHSASRLDDVRKRTSVADNEAAVAKLQAAGVGVVGNLMVDPNFDEGDFADLRRYVEEKEMHFAGYCVATPFPGTNLWSSQAQQLSTLDFELFDIQHAVVPTRLPLDRFYEEYAGLWRHRARIQPSEPLLDKARRLGRLVRQDGFHFGLLRNVLRFERDTQNPQAYLSDHREGFQAPWGSVAAPG